MALATAVPIAAPATNATTNAVIHRHLFGVAGDVVESCSGFGRFMSFIVHPQCSVETASRRPVRRPIEEPHRMTEGTDKFRQHGHDDNEIELQDEVR